MNPVLYVLVFYLLKIPIFGVAFDPYFFFPYLFLSYTKSNLKLNDVSVPQHLSYSL